MKKRDVIMYFAFIFSVFIVVSCSTTSLQKITPANKESLDSKADAVIWSLSEADTQLKQLTTQLLARNDPDEIRFFASDFYLKATDASIRGDAHIAAILFRYVCSLAPNDLHVMRKYAIELIRIGELAEALPILNELYSHSDRTDETIGLILAGVYTALNNDVQAREVYQNILNKNSKSEEACIFLAKSYLQENLFEKTDRILSNCQNKIRGNASFAYYRGKIAFSRGLKSKAEAYFREALAIDSEFAQAAVALGQIYEEQEKFVKAKNIYKNFLRKNPQEQSVLERIVQLMFLNDKSVDILPYIETMVSMDPSDLNTKVKLGVLYTDLERFADAKGVFEEILVVLPDSDKILYYLGALCKQLDQYEEAIEYFNRIGVESPLFRSGTNEIAKMLFAQTQPNAKGDSPQKAMKIFVEFVEEKVKRHDDLRLDLTYMLASFYEAHKQYLNAINRMKEVVNEKGYMEDHDYYLASLYEKNKDYTQARRIIGRILEKNPDHADALNFLGYSYLENDGDPTKAWPYLSRAIELKPNDGYIRDSIGWYYYKIGSYNKALLELQKANEMVKDDAVINKHLAIVYQELKLYDKARIFYLEALKNCKEDQEIKERLVRSLAELDKVRLPASQD